jgi:hypothetical protein
MVIIFSTAKIIYDRLLFVQLFFRILLQFWSFKSSRRSCSLRLFMNLREPSVYSLTFMNVLNHSESFEIIIHNDIELFIMIHERRFMNLHLNDHEPSRKELLNDQNCRCI